MKNLFLVGRGVRIVLAEVQIRHLPALTVRETTDEIAVRTEIAVGITPRSRDLQHGSDDGVVLVSADRRPGCVPRNEPANTRFDRGFAIAKEVVGGGEPGGEILPLRRM